METFVEIVMGFLALAVVALWMMVRKLTGQLVKINDKLIVVMGAEKGSMTARTLLAMDRRPRKAEPKPTIKKTEPPKGGMTYTMGSN